MGAAPELFVRCPARLGEGICWHPGRRSVAWVDILGGKVFEHRHGRMREWDCGQMAGAIAPTADGGFLAALHDGLYRLDPERGTWAQVARAPYDPAQFRFNDGKVDRRGRFWVGTFSLSGAEEKSALYCFEDNGACRVALEGVTISNGIAWTPDGRGMYYIDTPTRVVRRFDFDEARGEIAGGATAVSFADADDFPDGCCLDAEGNLWVAHWGGGRVTQSDPRTGRVLRSLALPVRNVTSCAFGGERLERLFISTARSDLEEPLAGSVFVMDPGTTGLTPNLA